MDLDYRGLETSAKAAISKSGIVAYSVVTSVAKNIYEDTLKEVPEDTTTLANAAFYDVIKSFASASAVIGYDGNAINPKTGRPVSEYVIAVHEDLEANHTKGKAKFLEDPVGKHASALDSTVANELVKAFKGMFRG